RRDRPDRRAVAAPALRDPPPGHARRPAEIPAAEMTPTLVFDLETLPDVEGLRRLHGWGPDIPDLEVAERAFGLRREATGSDFLPLHLHRIGVVGCVFRDDQGFRVRTLGQPDDPEPVL